MADEINAQNELDLIIKGMEEIDIISQEEHVELKYLDDAVSVYDQIMNLNDRTEEIESVEVDEGTERKGLFGGFFGSKKRDAFSAESDETFEAQDTLETPDKTDIPEVVAATEQVEPVGSEEDELQKSQRRIAELEGISAERLAELEKLSFEADEMRKHTMQLERQTLTLTEKTKQLNEEKEAMKKETEALESLLQEKYVRIEELEGMLRDPDIVSVIGLDIKSNDIRTMIRDVLPDIKAMAGEAMVNFALKVDDVYDPIVFCDRDRINSMIIKMIFCGLRYSNAGEQLKFSIYQKEPVASVYAEYIYSCVYKGDVVNFYSEEAAEMGGIVDIKRSEDGYVDMSVRFKFKIDIPELREKTLEIEKAVLEENL